MIVEKCLPQPQIILVNKFKSKILNVEEIYYFNLLLFERTDRRLYHGAFFMESN